MFEASNVARVHATYTYGNSLISMIRAGAETYYLSDGLGSTRQLANSDGAAIASYTYDGYGNLIAGSGTSASPYGFTGQQQFGEADSLVFLRARYYQPAVGRFVSRDPIGYDGGLNMYGYAGNNPVNLTDPVGLKDCRPNPTCDEMCDRQYQWGHAICWANYWATFNPAALGCCLYRNIVRLRACMIACTERDSQSGK